MTYRPAHDLDVGFAVMGVKSVRRRHGVWWWTTETPLGATTVAFRAGDGVVRADGWGPGVDWAFTALPDLLGRRDEPGGFRPDHPTVRALAERFASLRIGRTGRWYEAVAMAAIGQRVVRSDASAARERLCRHHGTPCDLGPANPFPTPATVLRLADHDFHRCGIERSRARVIRVAAAHADRLEALTEVPATEATRWLQRLPGVGPWTTALATSTAGGDPDAVPVGDLHIPRLVTRALTGVEGDDDAMLEALAPFAGHRQRVVRLVKMTRAGAPGHRPRPTRSDIRHL
jgi:3-methyladenine DNA glycosylase/8-oxoguanine DNA glycosylase